MTSQRGASTAPCLSSGGTPRPLSDSGRREAAGGSLSAAPAELTERARCARAAVSSLKDASHPCGFYLTFSLSAKKIEKKSRRMGSTPDQGIHGSYHDVQFESIPDTSLLIHKALC